MNLYSNRRTSGFVLIEALVALLVVAFAALAISKIATTVLSSAGDSRARSEAAALAESQLERLRNNIVLTAFNAALPAAQTTTQTVTGTNSTYTVTTTISSPNAGLEQRLVRVNVAWTSSSGEAMTLTLNSQVSWDNPDNQVTVNSSITQSAITPRGAAQRGETTYTPGSVPGIATGDGKTKIYKRSDGITELVDATSGKVILYLNPAADRSNVDFAQIKGRVYHDPGPNIPNMNTYSVRLSSEGECIFNNNPNPIPTVSGISYFDYTCYVGSGWYGNVGITSSSNNDFDVCVGDPTYNAGKPDGTLVGPYAWRSTVRSFRGFELVGTNYLSTGMQSASVYPSAAAGAPKPSALGYGTTSGSEADAFNNHYFITKLTGQADCSTVMPTALFAKNAGNFYCIKADSSAADDQCPDIWPGYALAVPAGSGGGGGGGGGGGSTPVCKTVVSGGGAYHGGDATISISPTGTGGTCTTEGGGGYTCINITLGAGQTITLTTSKKNSDSKLTSTQATCSSATANF